MTNEQYEKDSVMRALGVSDKEVDHVDKNGCECNHDYEFNEVFCCLECVICGDVKE